MCTQIASFLKNQSYFNAHTTINQIQWRFHFRSSFPFKSINFNTANQRVHFLLLSFTFFHLFLLFKIKLQHINAHSTINQIQREIGDWRFHPLISFPQKSININTDEPTQKPLVSIDSSSSKTTQLRCP